MNLRGEKKSFPPPHTAYGQTGRAKNEGFRPRASEELRPAINHMNELRSGALR